jgi:hypothetical protein
MNRCEKCQKEFKRPWMLKRHLERKTPCFLGQQKCNQNVTKMYPKCNQNVTKEKKVVTEFESSNIYNINTPELDTYNTQNSNSNLISNANIEMSTKSIKTSSNPLYKCEFCKRNFKHLRSIYRHKNELRCKNMPDKEIVKIINKKGNKSIISFKDNNNINDSINTKDYKGINNGTINNNNYNINNTQNITNITNKIELKINPMGQEDLSFMTKEDKLRIIGRMYNGITELVKTIHNYPENRNFFLPNTNKNVIAYLNGDNEIEYNDYNEMCEKILQDNMERLDELMTELETEVNGSIRKRLEKVFKKVDNGELDKKYLKDIKLYVLNNSKRNKDEINQYIDNIEKQMRESESEENEDEKIDDDNNKIDINLDTELLNTLDNLNITK